MSKRDDELDKEIRDHLSRLVEDFRAQGLSEVEARRRAQLELGHASLVTEECRDERPFQWLARLQSDFRFGLRSLTKQPAATLAIVFTVAICVALNTAVFTVVDSLLLRPLPFDRPDRLIIMSNQYPKAGVSDQDNSAGADFFDRPAAVPALAEHALYDFTANTFRLGGSPVQVPGLQVTPSFLPLLRARLAQGRNFLDSEAKPGQTRVLILTDSFARELSPNASPIGQEVRVNDAPFKVVGVLPKDFRFVSSEIRFLVPINLSPELARSRHSNSYKYIARLADGATIEQVKAQVDALNIRLLEQQPELRDLIVRAGYYVKVAYFQPWLMRQVQPSLQLLWLGALLVLLIGAVNLAGLALARANSKLRESATRLALGASWQDLARLCLIENILPACIGAGLGAAIGEYGLRFAPTSMLPGAAEIRPDLLVAAYALAGGCLAGALAGLAALIPLRKLILARAMHDGGRAGTTRGNKLRRLLVAGQVGLAFLLLNGAGVLTASLRELMKVDPGFQVANTWSATTYLPGEAFSKEEDLRKTYDRLLGALRQAPGVQNAALAGNLPYDSDFSDSVIMPEGYTLKPGESAISPTRLEVSPGFFDTLGIPFIEGRAFDQRDTGGAPRGVIIDESLAKRYWPNQSPLGRHMVYPTAPPDQRHTVIGVVRNIKHQNLSGEGNPNGAYYVALAQNTRRIFHLSWRGNADSVAGVRQAFQQVVPNAALFDVQSMTDRQELTLASRRVAQGIVGIFAAVALLLSGIGLYGLLAFLLSQRRREVGIRLALGCQPAGVAGLFLRDGLALTGLGLVAGLGLAWLAKPWLESQLYAVSPVEPWVIAGVAATLALVALLAILLPALRATRIDPTQVLHEQ